MSKELLICSTTLETKLVIVEDDRPTQVFVERRKNQGALGNICKGKVTRVLPGMQAAFVDIGLGRDAFLYVSDFVEDYEEYERLFTETDEGGMELFDESADQVPNRGNRVSQRLKGTGRQRFKRGDRDEVRTDGNGSAKRAQSLHRSFPADPHPLGQMLPDRLSALGPQSEVTDEPHSPPPALADESPGIPPDRLETVLDYPSTASVNQESVEQETPPQVKDELKRLAAPSPARLQTRKTPNPSNNRTLIGDLLKEGQEILVQVAKEPIGKKGARVTSHVALPGRYLVFMPTVEHIGVSRKIVSERERQRLKNAVLKLRGDSGKGFIVRTVGEGQKESDFRQDMAYLTRLWEDIRSKAERLSAPAVVHSELGLVQRVLRDYFCEDYRAARVDDEQLYERIVDFLNTFSPDLVDRVRLYNKNLPIFDEYGVTSELEGALKQKVWLSNGGYIVINQTEALVAVDVNTGKFVGSTNSLEDTITQTNLDAVEEVVRQIRLRDLGGIIIIDFIDMDERKNRQKVMEALHEELSKDKSPSKILRFNEFGLVAITRKRAKQSLERVLCQPCKYCGGRGLTRSVQTVCYSIHQEVRRMLPYLEDGLELLIRCHPDVSRALQDRERQVVTEIEEMTGKAVSMKGDPLMHIEQFDLAET